MHAYLAANGTAGYDADNSDSSAWLVDVTLSEYNSQLTLHANVSSLLAASGGDGGGGGGSGTAVNVTVHELPLVEGTGLVVDCSSSGDGAVFGGGAGDLSAHASLDNSGVLTIATSDLTLHGKQTVMGRALVIRVGDAAACGNIGFNGERVVQEAWFGDACKGDNDTECVRGYMRVEQAKVADQVVTGMADTSETLFIVDVYRHGNATPTAMHNWHVHMEPVGQDPSDCGATGGHFDPFEVCEWTGTKCADPYPLLCTPDTPLACEVGDQSKKLSPIDIPPAHARRRVAYVDVQAPVFGPVSISDRSLVIHDKNLGAPRIACASLHDKQPPPVRTREVTATLVSAGAARGPVTVTFTQTGRVLRVSAGLTGVDDAQQLSYFAVHELPVAPDTGAGPNCDDLGAVLHQGLPVWCARMCVCVHVCAWCV